MTDHPELSNNEAKIVASTLLRCSEYANQVGSLPNLNVVSDTSPCSSDGANIESGNARHNGITELTSAPATPDLPIVGQCSDDPIVEPLPRPPFSSYG